MAEWCTEVAEVYWKEIGHTCQYPRDLQSVTGLAYPVDFVSLPQLRVQTVEQWLVNRGIAHHFGCRDRALCGCIVAVAGCGIVFTCSTDTAAELRYTIAHEVAHFLLDHWLPRARAINAFGDNIISALDGARTLSFSERVHAMLVGIDLGTYTNLFIRSEDGRPDWNAIVRSEERADLLALELLAPRQIVMDRVLGSGHNIENECTSELQAYFGLPPAIAAWYARSLFSTTYETTRKWLGVR